MIVHEWEIMANANGTGQRNEIHTEKDDSYYLGNRGPDVQA